MFFLISAGESDAYQRQTVTGGRSRLKDANSKFQLSKPSVDCNFKFIPGKILIVLCLEFNISVQTAYRKIDSFSQTPKQLCLLRLSGPVNHSDKQVNRRKNEQSNIDIAHCYFSYVVPSGNILLKSV